MIKKVLYGCIYGFIGVESIIVISKFYILFKNDTKLYIGGMPIAPYWLLVEGSMILISPLLFKLITNTYKNGRVADNSELANLIKKLNNKKKEITDGIK